MVCQRIGGAIVCGPAPRIRRCVGCGVGLKPGVMLLCDARLKGGGTCDKPICPKCTTKPAEGKDLCPNHARQYERLQRSGS